MNILLAAIGFKNGNIEFNKNVIIKVIKECSNNIDLILFGESFLQGFDSLTWNFETDKNIAISQNNEIINEIRDIAKEKCIAVSFGYFELDEDSIYSSQIVIDKFGTIIHNYRRVSTGWRVSTTDYHYKEGNGFQTFKFYKKNVLVALCGDLWFDENVSHIKDLKPDIVLWPVYTDFNYHVWNKTEKIEYAKQVKTLKSSVLYVNSVCLDKDDLEIARGGAAHLENGKIIEEVPAGKEEKLLIHI